MSAEPTPTSSRRWIALTVLVVVAMALAVAFVVSRSESGEDVVIAPSPTATATETESAEPGHPPPPPPSEPTEPPTTEPSEPQPTDEDVAAFVAANGPADEEATGDVDGDGTDEVVLASIRNNAVQVVLGVWNGKAFVRSQRDDGGPAQAIAGLTVTDYNRQPGAEIVTEQTAGTEGRSISVWGPGDGGIARQEAKGGCWAGFHTYGISGATIEPGRITATCDGSPEPPDSWASDVYEWRKGRWRFVRSEQPGE